MAGDELGDFGRRVEKIVGRPALDRIMSKAGGAGKKAALDAASAKLGGDRRMSNFRRGRGPALGAGYDIVGQEVHVNLRPAGMWKLAQSGRRSSGIIRPKRRGGKKALMTPWGPRATSSYGPSRGLKVWDDAVDKAGRDVPKAAARQFSDEVRRAMRG